VKGPYERLKYDLRRVFECPVCRRRVRMPGHVTSVNCNCSPDAPQDLAPFMKLVEEGPRRTDGRSPGNRSRWPACPDDST
jgi:hypothetical protein